jgi:hypothetical protein
MLPATTTAGRQTTEHGHQRPPETRTFPIDPNAPGGPDRSAYLARHHLARPPVRARLPTLELAQAGPA